MKVKIKICGIRSKEDAKFCDEKQVDFLGFNFYKKSPRYINPREAQKIIKTLKNSIPVGLFVNEERQVIDEIIEKTGIKILQFHGNEEPEFLAQFDLKKIKAIGIENEEDLLKLKKYEMFADFILLDKKSKIFGGTGNSFNWEFIKNKNFSKPIFIAGGLSQKNLTELFEFFSPFAIDIASGVETEGKKDFKKIEELIKLARNEKT